MLGRNLRIARIRRRLTLEDVAGRVGVSRLTIAELEKGKPGTSAAAYFGVLWALGLLHQADGLAAPHADDEGQALELARLPRRARRPPRL